MSIIQNFLHCPKGATAVEYGLIGAGIGFSIVAAAFAFGEDLSILFDGLSAVTNN